MKIGVLGLGNIAQKAYLPLYSKMQAEHDFILASRSPEKAIALQKKYGFSAVASSADDLLAQHIEACFIHTATSTHYALAKKMLTAGVAVYLDKPLSENLAEAQELVALSETSGVPLVVGFNRRFVPLLQPLKNATATQFIVQKNRVNDSGAVAYELYDLFIHVLDTALYLLADTPQLADYEIVAQDDQLARVFCRLQTPTQTALVSCNLQAGANFEMAESQGAAGIYRLENLARLTHFNEAGETVTVPSDWQETLVTRGFNQAVDYFLAQVEQFSQGLPFVAQKNQLASHELIATMLAVYSLTQL